MKLNFEQLQQQYGTEVVWQQQDFNKKQVVVITFDTGDENGMVLDEKYKNLPDVGVEFFTAYGDDQPNAVHINDLDNVPQDVVDYINEHIGESCYD